MASSPRSAPRRGAGARGRHRHRLCGGHRHRGVPEQPRALRRAPVQPGGGGPRRRSRRRPARDADVARRGGRARYRVPAVRDAGAAPAHREWRDPGSRHPHHGNRFRPAGGQPLLPRALPAARTDQRGGDREPRCSSGRTSATSPTPTRPRNMCSCRGRGSPMRRSWPPSPPLRRSDSAWASGRVGWWPGWTPTSPWSTAIPPRTSGAWAGSATRSARAASSTGSRAATVTAAGRGAGATRRGAGGRRGPWERARAPTGRPAGGGGRGRWRS